MENYTISGKFPDNLVVGYPLTLWARPFLKFIYNSIFLRLRLAIANTGIVIYMYKVV